MNKPNPLATAQREIRTPEYKTLVSPGGRRFMSRDFMTQKRIFLPFLLLLLLLFASCREEINQEYDSITIFETAWDILDTKYCFFKEKNVDWDKLHNDYLAKIKKDTPQDSLFYIIGNMICELKDGHVNLYSSKDVIRYWKWFADYPVNFDEKLEDIYLGKNYSISSGICYTTIKGDIGYLTYRNFSSGINDNGLDHILTKYQNSPGIIIDIRNNTGGDLSNVDKIACRFTETGFTSGYISHKTGPGHNDFSELYPVRIEPSERVRYKGKVVVLANRSCYSAANFFVAVMKQLPNVTIMGDKSGGGGGFPINSELPNGWLLRFSSCPNYDQNKALIEDGIEPDVHVNLKPDDVDKGIDTIIEEAVKFLQK